MSTKTGLIDRLLVYSGGVQVGYGYILVDYKGKVHVPNLFANDGSQLPEQWYNLVATGESSLVVLTRRIQ